jgi:TolB-like protein/Tfp pilus assembly protein PilF
LSQASNHPNPAPNATPRRSLFEELRRRNVIRAGVLYVVAAWVLLQVADVLFDAMDLPSAWKRLVLVILLLGLPLVVIFSWVFEITPEGVKREAEVDHDRLNTYATTRRLDLVTIGLLIIAILIVGVDRFASKPASQPETARAALTQQPDSTIREEAADADPEPGPAVGDASIAVMPFLNFGASADQDYFSDGLTEELISLLGKVPNLRVIARTSTFAFKGQNVGVKTIGQRLNVAHVLEGSVRASGHRLRITTNLVNTATASNVWSQVYDGNLDDVFKVQDEIAASVVRELRLKLLGDAPRTRNATKNTDAYDLYLRGRHLYADRSATENVARAIDLYRRAIELDPRYALPWAALANAYSLQADLGTAPMETAYALARAAAQKALRLDPELVDAHLAMARVYYLYDWDWQSTEAAYEAAKLLEPGNGYVVRFGAYLASTLGRFDEAIELQQRSLDQDPLRWSAYNGLALACYYGGQLNRAEDTARKLLELNPTFPGGHETLGQILIALNKPAEALAAIKEEPDDGWRQFGLPIAYHALGLKKESDEALAQLLSERGDSFAYQIAEIYAFRNQVDKAFEWLERAYDQRDSGLVEMMGDPLLVQLRDDPRYVAMLKRLRLRQ